MRRCPGSSGVWGLGAAGTLVVLVVGLGPGVRSAAPGVVGEVGGTAFGSGVLPILAGRCFKCHGPDEAARQANLRLDTREGATAELDEGVWAIVPGDLDSSELIRRIRSKDPEYRMPPAKIGPALGEEEIATLERWVEQGAEYAPLWSLVAPRRVEPPAVAARSAVRNPIDAFVLERLERAGLEGSPEADRRTLIRRVSLDLVGLPPTPEEVEAFVGDARPDAYERVVDRLLASPHFGERWARVWLDLARYADTRGYEADRRRTMWPWRDWVIEALNADTPFDRFTIEQIAGDLLPGAGPRERIATGFHRNTMNNDEGGTDDEEFRTAAVIDRVNTTMQVWMGLTAGCAQCHSHKYDPISHTDYYRLLAFLNNTEDADRPDEEPTLAVMSEAETARARELEERAGAAASEARAILRELAYEDPAPSLAPPEALGAPVDRSWIDDDVPAGAEVRAEGGSTRWEWATGPEHPVLRGARSMLRDARGKGVSQHFFTGADEPLQIGEGDVLYAHVHLDPAAPPQEIMLQWHEPGGSWEHRAYWGENMVGFGADGTPARLRLGDLPAPGEWTRLEIPAARVGLEPGAVIDGWAFTQHGGVVHWDDAGLRSRHAQDQRYLLSQSAWEERERTRASPDVPAEVRRALGVDAAARTPEQAERVGLYYLSRVCATTRDRFARVNAEADETAAALKTLRDAAPRVPILRELPPDRARTTHRLLRGSFLNPGEAVEPGVPPALHPLETDGAPDRLDLARWLVSPGNPLTARVTVNRFWEQFFGVGIVSTVEDFGTQGSPPTHPELLDWLAATFEAPPEESGLGWSMKGLCRLIVTSATYRQSSRATPELLAADPENRLLTRGPRVRLDAETVRDQALALSGLLSPKVGGPPVFPVQPEGVWSIVYNSDQWVTSEGEDRHRRGIYTFWRRTSPYPSMVAFDAPSREFCVARRVRTNTPLQALVTLNDPVFVEAAQALARRVVGEGGASDERAGRLLRRCLVREPEPEEVERIAALVAAVLPAYRADPEGARAMATEPLGPAPEGSDVAELAAWTVAANVVLNLDELLTKP